MKLTAQNVNAVVTDCLAKPGEITKDQETEMREQGRAPDGWKIVKGAVVSVALNTFRTENHRQDIKDMLADLPDQFHEDKGGGWSFLNACMTKSGDQWGEHRDIDFLICLGMALDLAKFCLPRDIWPSLPGGMPYFSVKTI